MNYTQNEKIAQVTETTLVIGIDVGSENHYARAFDFRGIEYSRKAMCFTNTRQGFNEFLTWAFELCQANQKNDIIVGAEPTAITGSICESFCKTMASSWYWSIHTQ